MIVVADTSPLCYLVLIDCADVLPELFGQVTVPHSVRDELLCEGAPNAVRAWIERPPRWLEVRHVAIQHDPSLAGLHRGERDAILLAEQMGADLIILDEKAARQLAAERGLNVTGLLGILVEAAKRGVIDLASTVERLRRTTFRVAPQILKSLLDHYEKGR